jgi:hypothetical protein
MPARAVIELSTYVLEPLWKDAEFILYRGRREDDGSRLLLATPVEEHPRPESLKLLEHANTFKADLDAAWAARPIAITREAHRGRLWVGSNTPTGAVFQFTLAVSAVPVEPSNQSS